jgi:DNA-directed RNA polymerase subunit beta'
MKTSSLEKVIYFQDYVVINKGDDRSRKLQLLTEEEYRAAKAQYGEGSFEADMGAEAVRKLLAGARSWSSYPKTCVKNCWKPSKQKKKDLINRLEVG